MARKQKTNPDWRKYTSHRSGSFFTCPENQNRKVVRSHWKESAWFWALHFCDGSSLEFQEKKVQQPEETPRDFDVRS